MKIAVEAYNTADIWRLTGPVKLRIYANQSFWTSDGQYIPQGTPGQANTAYLEIAGEVLANVLTLPGFEIDSTVDSPDNPWATYTAELSAGSKRIPFLSTFAVNTLVEDDPSYTWIELILFRNQIQPQSIPESLDRQVAAMVTSAVGALNKASDLNPGVTALTTSPDDPSFPKAVGANDPAFTELAEGNFPATGVVPGTYSRPVIEVGADGRLLSAANSTSGLTSVGLVGAEQLLTITDSPRTTDGDIALSINSQTVNGTTTGANIATLEAEVNGLKEALRAQGLVQYAVDLSALPGVLLGWRADNQGYVDGVAQGVLGDSSGNGNDGIQATGSKQPIAIAGAQAGKTVLRFDGVDDFLAFTTPLANIRTVYIVYKHTTPKDNDTVLGHVTSFNYTGGSSAQLFNPGAVSAAVLNAAVAVNGYADTAVNLMRPTTEFQIITLVTTGNTTADSIFNDRRTALRYINGDFAELWLYSADHDTSEQAQALSTLKSRWGVTNTKPLRRRIAFDGDSITSLGAFASSFSVRVVNCLDGNCASPTPITNGLWFGDVYALTGQTVVQMQADAATQVDPTFNGHRIKEILLAFGGTNDLYLGGTVAALQANYQAYCEARRAVGYKVVAATILPRSNPGTPVTFETDRQAFNIWLRGSYTAFADALADFAADPSMGDAGDETNATLYADLVHPTDAGYDILAPIAANAINSI
jgi:hypothetical protein